ncbi:MAG: CoA transferase, partial [Burkholderiaceae bacterium]|nr:CoA transferase [Burkholderiaceae bacterium]
EEIDAAIGAWSITRSSEDVLQALGQASVPSGRIYTIADIAADPHYAARGMFSSVRLEDGSELAVPGFVPRLSRTPGAHRRNAPALGQDTEDVLREVGITDAQLQALRARGVIGP